MSDPLPPNPGDTSLQQTTTGDRNQAIGQILGGIVVYVSGGQAIINTGREAPAPDKTSTPLGPNPYKGLMAFQETDGDRFFGREKQIAVLWEKLRSLHETESAIRVLPIYGPSGSGKSSLARAGLIPELARRPIPGYNRARIAILVPGTHPLESLATVLARIVTQDLTPVAKTREFAGELEQTNGTGEYDGLRRIADVMPDVASAPLVVLVDQFEEVYTLCEDKTERDAFIGNLLHAAGDRAKRLTVIITLRSDFLGETQKHPVLNQLFSEQGYLVPAMTPEELRQAIAKPAELAGHSLDTATINLLVKDTEGREGALPLLQFALTRIWEGLTEGKQPAETLKAIGGVGGALAGEAQRIYDSLDEEERAIARRLFLGLVQLGEGTKDTRRRTLLNSLISYQNQPIQVKQIINLFAAPGVRLITLSTSGNTETAEVTHEALFDHWQQLRVWLESSRSDIRFQRRLDEAAHYWDEQGRPEGNLWRPPDLDLLKRYQQYAKEDMTSLQIEFFRAAEHAEDKRKRVQRFSLIGLILGIVLTSCLAFLARYQQQLAQEQRQEADLQRNIAFARELATRASLSEGNLQEFNDLTLLQQEFKLKLGLDSFSPQVVSLLGEIEPRIIRFSPDGAQMAVIDSSSLLHIFDIKNGKEINSPGKEVYDVSFSPDGWMVASAGRDGTLRLWSRTGQVISSLKGHADSLTATAFSPDGKLLVTASSDKTVKLWSLTGNLLRTLVGHTGIVNSAGFSPDGQYLLTASSDHTARLWTASGKEIAVIQHEDSVKLAVFTPNMLSIATVSGDSTVRFFQFDQVVKNSYSLRKN